MGKNTGLKSFFPDKPVVHLATYAKSQRKILNEFLAAGDVKLEESDIMDVDSNMKILAEEWLMGVLLICLFVWTAISQLAANLQHTSFHVSFHPFSSSLGVCGVGPPDTGHPLPV